MGGVSPVRIVASTLFRAEGCDVAIKTPFELSAQIRSFPSRCGPRPPLSAEFRVGALCEGTIWHWSTLTFNTNVLI